MAEKVVRRIPPGGQATQRHYADAINELGAQADDAQTRLGADETRLSAAEVSITALEALNGREVLQADRTYYVATTGSDSNDGLTVGNPFLTVQKGIDVAAALDLSIYAIEVIVADGTYAAGATFKSYVGSGPISVIGDVATPTNTVLQGGILSNTVFGAYEIRGFRITTSDARCIFALGAPTKITVGAMEYGAAGVAHLQAKDGAILNYNANYSITAGTGRHILATKGGIVSSSGGAYTITMSGTQNYTSAFVDCQTLSLMQINGQTYTGGTITGKRYNVTANAVVDTLGGGPNAFPGDLAGITDGFGAYF